MKHKYIIGATLLLGISSVAFATVSSALVPTTEGSYLQWTPSTGTTHYTLVDEATCNTTDYNSTVTVSNRGSYSVGLSSIPDGSVVSQIDITPCASKNSNGSGGSTMNVFYRLNGVNSADAGAYALSGTNPSTLTATTFSGLGFVKSPSTALEVGAVYSLGTRGVKLSKITATLTYSPLPAPTNVTSSATSSQITLNWSDTSYEDNFVIERKNVTASTTYSTIATTTKDTIMYVDSGLSASTTYSYRLRSYAGGGYSAYSSTTQATTLP